jgi:energy-converting hydrogenase A subunit M
VRSDPGLRNIIRVQAVLVGVLLGVYTVVVLLVSPEDLIGWFSTLASTVASVWAALVLGLFLFQHQTQATDRKKKEELEKLLKTELGEVSRLMGRLRTDKTRYVLHFTHPLIVEEAARSGLFDTEQTSVMLTLARLMRQHNVLRQEAMTLRMEKERARVASGEVNFTRALSALQSSEEEIRDRCTKLLESMP